MHPKRHQEVLLATPYPVVTRLIASASVVWNGFELFSTHRVMVPKSTASPSAARRAPADRRACPTYITPARSLAASDARRELIAARRAPGEGLDASRERRQGRTPAPGASRTRSEHDFSVASATSYILRSHGDAHRYVEPRARRPNKRRSGSAGRDAPRCRRRYRRPHRAAELVQDRSRRGRLTGLPHGAARAGVVGGDRGPNGRTDRPRQAVRRSRVGARAQLDGRTARIYGSVLPWLAVRSQEPSLVRNGETFADVFTRVLEAQKADILRLRSEADLVVWAGDFNQSFEGRFADAPRSAEARSTSVSPSSSS